MFARLFSAGTVLNEKRRLSSSLICGAGGDCGFTERA